MDERLLRTEMLLGKEAVEKLKNSTVAIFGLGGVGGYAAEAIARCGVGHMVLIDNDTISRSNLNRQIIALESTEGRLKTDVMAERIHDINPNINVECHNVFFLPGNNDIITDRFDYVIDAIDTVSGKIEIIMQCAGKNIPVISSMGTGNKLDPSRLKVADIYKTSVCPLAKVMRRELKARGIKKLKVVYSDELPRTPILSGEQLREEEEKRRKTPASIAFVPPAAGLLIASEVIRDLAEV
jgi:tRNA A37 threonylcarbamoyladenosine dehydratase